MDANEYTQRLAVAEQILHRKVQDWRDRPAYTDLLPSGTALVGLAGVATVIGFCAAGPIGALVVPDVLHLPILMIAGSASDISLIDYDIWHRHRAEAYATAGIDGVRDPRFGPSWTDRLVKFFGRKPAEAILSRAREDVARRRLGCEALEGGVCRHS